MTDGDPDLDGRFERTGSAVTCHELAAVALGVVSRGLLRGRARRGKGELLSGGQRGGIGRGTGPLTGHETRAQSAVNRVSTTMTPATAAVTTVTEPRSR